MNVAKLTSQELAQLKVDYFHSRGARDGYDYADEVPDKVIFDQHACTEFSPDDFWCNSTNYDGYGLYDFEGDFVEYAHNVTGVKRIASALKVYDPERIDALTLHLNRAARDWLAADADDTDGQDAIIRQAFQEIVKALG